MKVGDFVLYLNKFAESRVPSDNIEFPSSVFDEIKINTNAWGSTSALNFHTAQYMQAVQKDVLKAWNMATGQNIKLSELEKYPFLIVKFNIQDGCIDIKHTLDFVRNFMEGMTPKQKIIALTLVVIGITPFSTSYMLSTIADSGLFDSDDIKTIKLMAKEKESTQVIIKDSQYCTVTFNGKEWTNGEIIRDNKKIDSVNIARLVTLDGEYIVNSCKLEGGLYVTSVDTGKSLTVDLDYLEESKLNELKRRVADAVLKQEKLTVKLRIDGKMRAGTNIRSHIIDIDQPAREKFEYEEPKQGQLQGKEDKSRMQQASLLDIE